MRPVLPVLAAENHRLSAIMFCNACSGADQRGTRLHSASLGWRQNLLPLPLGVGGGENESGNAGTIVLRRFTSVSLCSLRAVCVLDNRSLPPVAAVWQSFPQVARSKLLFCHDSNGPW